MKPNKKKDEELISSFLDRYGLTIKAKRHTIILKFLQIAIKEDKTLKEVMQEYDVRFTTETFSKDGDYFLQAEVRKMEKPLIISDKMYKTIANTFILPILSNEDREDEE